MAFSNSVARRRVRVDSGPSERKKPKTCCGYGENCYRRNPLHFSEYLHPHCYKAKIDTSIILDQLQIYRDQGFTAEKDVQNAESQKQNTEDDRPVSVGNQSVNQGSDMRKGFAFRLAKASPYNFFLTAVRDSPPTHNEVLSIRFHELLDPTMGDLDSSLQINFMVELDWLLEMYKVYGHESKPLFILYGEEDDMLKNPKSLPQNITAKKIKPSAFGHHHTKMSVFYYKDNSLRVVVSTANLISSDWYNRTQGVWVSPLCPQLPPNSDTKAGESPTEFKADLLRYMAFYELPALQEWMSRLRKTDFSAIRVFFVASVPGSHRGPESEKWGHRRLGHLLKKHVEIPSLLSPSRENWPVVAQCSSIGTLGTNPDSWMCGELRGSMSQRMMRPGDMLQPPPQFRVIYPSFRNVKNSHDDLLGGQCLPYSGRTHEKQTWFTKFLFEWKSDKRHRSKAIPHIKTYARVSTCGRYLAWFHLTSANLSKAAWGKLQEPKGKGSALYIMSYEAGVLFVPKLLVNEEVFALEGERVTANKPSFPLPWDLPLSAYDADDKPWVSEYLY
ncbi:probable tyrosyl-DNA phosphodiesterase isoform X2 [Zootermopsis nevadensis]|uniref:probable tyrosyl-DNA phosphodiesterase isoform X2 n=1 Tax=Zootermopsis nevadensis TaxID=136037 RepID=UPI000B8EBB25|nr:probable tyrosyl-DNA phosphodiesterase isoform X2 [Zootermopsis nevadensis]